MQVYRYRIKLESAFATPMRSDTLYGQMLCAAAELDGTVAVTKLINSFTAHRPPFVLSSAFPSGKLPKPVLSGIRRAMFREQARQMGTGMFELLSEYKKYRKISYITVDDWREANAMMSNRTLFLQYLNRTHQVEKLRQKKHRPANPVRAMHNTIDRNENRVMRGGLYSDEAHYFSPDETLDLYVKTADRETFERLFGYVATTGFGADTSTGKGQFRFDLDSRFNDAIFNHHGNAVMSLSVCMAEQTERFDGTWNMFTKLGKVWNGFGETNPFKKPFVAFSEGSVFTAMPDSDYVLRHIHSNPDYVQIGLPLTLPLTVEETAI